MKKNYLGTNQNGQVDYTKQVTNQNGQVDYTKQVTHHYQIIISSNLTLHNLSQILFIVHVKIVFITYKKTSISKCIEAINSLDDIWPSSQALSSTDFHLVL